MRTLHAIIEKNAGERKISSRGHGKENSEKLGYRRNKFILLDSRRLTN